MSISAAVAALDKEILILDKKRARLGALRDALVVEGDRADNAVVEAVPAKGKPGPKPGAKKAKPGPKPGAAKKGKPGPKPGVAKKESTLATSATANKSVAPKKRVMSPEAKKKIGDAVKARWAAKASTKKTA